MGTTLTTLSLYGVARSALTPMLAPTDILRDQNLPWLTVVPSHETEIDDVRRLGRLAGRITQSSGTAALLFNYFDDDLFSCHFYQDGRKKAACESNASWAKLGKKLNELFESDEPSKAFRYASHCCSLEEQIQLLEETVGAALYDLQEEEARTVPRSDSTVAAIKKREALLRKRPNQFALTEIAREDWPEEMKLRQSLLEMLRPQWQKYDLSTLLYEMNMKRCLVPGSHLLVAYPYLDNKSHQARLFLFNGETKETQDLGPFPDVINCAVWNTANNEQVILFHQTLQEQCSKYEWSLISGLGYVSCLGNDETERWRFSPAMHPLQVMSHIYSSPEGIITFFAKGINAAVKADTLIWQINGETGELLHFLSIPYTDEVFELTYVQSISTFIYYKRSAKELVFLDENLHETRRLYGYEWGLYLTDDHFCGNYHWYDSDLRSVYISDLRDGSVRKVSLEIPVYLMAILADGRIIGVNEKQNILTVFSSSGTVVSRFTVSGEICRVISENERTFIVEQRGPDTYGMVYGGLFDVTSTHIWRLDSAAKGDI